ncbi:DUF3152 domain-containing protein [Streptomyces sp. NPDC047022]|uniref:DUF3152 domain-containing protein n=1 Tax=Streptomyces sp. NPDC047022 TaxID=3155737 RepID=UPI0033C49395
MGRHSRKGRGNRTNADTANSNTDTGGAPRYAEGTPARGVPRFPGGAADPGVPRPSERAPAGGVPLHPVGTPAHGVPRFPDGTPAHGTPGVRGGHPQQREPGGGWGEFGRGTAPAAAPPQAAPPGAVAPGRSIPRIPHQRSRSGSPRQEYVDAFDDDVFAPRRGVTPGSPPGPPTGDREAGADAEGGEAAAGTDGTAATETGQTPPRTGGKGRTAAGITAAAVVTVLAVVVAGQFAEGAGRSTAQSRATSPARDIHGAEPQQSPSAGPNATPLAYAQAMAVKYPLGATLKGPGTFSVVPGSAKAPGTGHKYTYRVDMENGLGLDGELFAEAVQKTLNDDRSWAHKGARTFERVSSGKPDFVITLASPGTTAVWCAKSDLDTAEENVSCDSASTERVMINAYRWAQGSTTYGNAMYAYRQMLINHEVGHRLGYGHVSCDKDGELAPVMQQQTKFLDHDGIHCLPNPWPFPRG